jgi:hypothetical protein
MPNLKVVGYYSSLTRDGDGNWDYSCPVCYQPYNPAIKGYGRPCPRMAPVITSRSEGERKWFAVTCGECGHHEDKPRPEPVYSREG